MDTIDEDGPPYTTIGHFIDVILFRYGVESAERPYGERVISDLIFERNDGSVTYAVLDYGRKSEIICGSVIKSVCRRLKIDFDDLLRNSADFDHTP